jgi:hypothetical protein
MAALRKKEMHKNFVLGIVSGKDQLEPDKQTETWSYLGYLWKRVVGVEVK